MTLKKREFMPESRTVDTYDCVLYDPKSTIQFSPWAEVYGIGIGILFI